MLIAIRLNIHTKFLQAEFEKREWYWLRLYVCIPRIGTAGNLCFVFSFSTKYLPFI